MQMIQITINIYKNQVSRKIKKMIYICSTRCNECNPYNLLILLNKRRQKLADETLNEFKTCTSIARRRKLHEKIKRKSLVLDDLSFVEKEGR